jgi:hypothetical protein
MMAAQASFARAAYGFFYLHLNQTTIETRAAPRTWAGRFRTGWEKSKGVI